MKIEKKLQDKQLTLKPLGRIDTVTALELAAAVALDGITEIIFDLAEVDYVSSAGLRVFLSTARQMEAAGGKMSIANPKELVMEIFDVAGFSDVFHFL